jgi:hypothetical protein
MKRLVAVADAFYNGRTYHAGESFDCEDMWVPILVGLGSTRLEDLPPTPKPASAPLQTQALTAEDDAPPQKPMTTHNTDALVPPPARNKKRTYKRRDMRAED